MLGKIAAAIVGQHVAGRGKGAKGAIAGIAVETVAKRVIPAIVVIGIGAYAYKKLSDLLDEEFGSGEPAYPPEASPAPPSSASST